MPGPIRDKDGKLTGPMSGKDKKKKNTTDGLELTVNRKEKNFQEQMQDLLSKKDKLVKQDAGDGRNKYQVAVNNLKKKIKEYNKDLKNNEPKVRFNTVLQGVKKQEREGTFDRGAEGKAKKALRKKMLDKQDGSKRGGVHAGTRADEENKLIQRVMDDPEYKAMKKKSKTNIGKSR